MTDLKITDSTSPHNLCKLIWEGLQRDGKALDSYCQKCLRNGIRCRVDDHPSEASPQGKLYNFLLNILPAMSAIYFYFR